MENGMPLIRKLSEQILTYLNTSPPWWRDVLAARYCSASGEERPLLIALRDNYLSIYADGQAVLEARFDARSGQAELRGKIHRKYVHGRKAGDGYLRFDGEVVDPKGTAVVYGGPETLCGWVERALDHSGQEKRGVAAIVQRHPNIIDVELALPARNPGTLGNRAVAPRVDMVALEETDAGIQVVFYEAKLFENTCLRADNLRPEVLTQLATYDAYFSNVQVQKEVIEAYRNTCRVLCQIHAMRGTSPCALVQAVAEDAPLSMDPKPRLIVFGYTADRVGQGSFWHRHEETLRAGCTLLMGERPEDVRLPCGALQHG
jgi:hypothetical protein